MRILTTELIAQFCGKIINVHPSLLPKFKGTNTHQRVIDSGELNHGASVHFVTEELDSGPVILQAKILVKPTDTADTLAQRVLAEEHKILPQVIQWFAEGKIQINGDQLTMNEWVIR